jgi:hypothetical protein
MHDLRAKYLIFRMAMVPADSTLRENAGPGHKKAKFTPDGRGRHDQLLSTDRIDDASEPWGKRLPGQPAKDSEFRRPGGAAKKFCPFICPRN